MKNRSALAAVVLLAASLVGPPPATANRGVVTAAGGAYVPPGVVIVQGTGLTFVNLDMEKHDLRSDDGFSAVMIGQGETAEVEGVEDLAPSSYPFYCSVHEGMFGVLEVVGP